MGYLISAVALSPLLLFQARRVRRVTPRLPEPEGPRDGTEGSGDPLRLLIIGDSAAAGVGAESQSAALSGQLVSRLSDHYRVDWCLHATTGHTISDLLERLARMEAACYDVVVVSIGVNDVTHGTGLRQWHRCLEWLCDELSSRFGTPRIILSSVPPMEVFPALPQPLRWLLGRRAGALNRVMSRVAERRSGCDFLAPAFPLTREYIATDGFHPSPLAYRLWAEQVGQWVVDSRGD